MFLLKLLMFYTILEILSGDANFYFKDNSP